MRNRLVLMTSVLAAAALAVFARAFADPYVLGSPLGAPSFVEAPSAEDSQCALYGDEQDTALSVLAFAAGGTAAYASTCAIAEHPTSQDAQNVPAAANAVAAEGPVRAVAAATDEYELTIVHARVGAHGTIEVLGRPNVPVDRRVLEVVARELAFPQTLKRGTSIDAVYEDRGAAARLAALTIGKGIAARHAYYFRSHGEAVDGFFARDGQSLEHRFLRYPLSFDLVSSPFSASRYHPILCRRRPHNGVDFAARFGTPVLAVGSGTVKSARWETRYGRTIEIKHGDGYVSRYSHLQGFARSIRPGATVSKGQLIGFVGNSGMTTGPHLHFSMLKNGGYLDPLGRFLPKRASLDAKTLGAFRTTVARVERAFTFAATKQSPQIASGRKPEAERNDRRGG